VADDFAPPGRLAGTGEYDPASAEFAELRELLLGGERRQLEELRRRLDSLGITPEELAELLPEAIALRAGRDRQLARALAPTVENAISESVRRNPREIATAIFPVLGPAIRKAIAETMAGLVESINRAVEHSISLRGIAWRIEGWRTGVPYAQIVLRHSLVYRVEQVYFIHSETGLLLAHAAAADLKVADADLISGMLTAIQDFVSDSFAIQEGGELRTFCVGELTVMVERGPQAVIAAVVRGPPPDTLLLQLQDALETLHFQFAPAFAEYNGDAAPFAGARSRLEELLVTVLNTDRGQRPHGRAVWLRWAIPLLLVVLIAGGLMWRSRQRWSAAVSRLEAAPGIVLVSAERDGGRWKFRGLRDPMAADPAALLADLEKDPSRIEATWETYLSMEPELVLARARRRLAVPATVQLSLSGDTLAARGTAPLPWVAASAALGALPGVTHLDLSGVDALLPDELAVLERSIEGNRILFAAGSAALGPASGYGLRALAQAFRRLAAGVAGMGYRVNLELIGRADTTGTESGNQTLSRMRVVAVRARLVSLGLPADGLNATGIGTSQPLPAPDEAERARINRSVSFLVHLQPAARQSNGAP
jgi:OOP family OmpA-OmpF porin